MTPKRAAHGVCLRLEWACTWSGAVSCGAVLLLACAAIALTSSPLRAALTAGAVIVVLVGAALYFKTRSLTRKARGRRRARSVPGSKTRTHTNQHSRSVEVHRFMRWSGPSRVTDPSRQRHSSRWRLGRRLDDLPRDRRTRPASTWLPGKRLPLGHPPRIGARPSRAIDQSTVRGRRTARTAGTPATTPHWRLWHGLNAEPWGRDDPAARVGKMGVRRASQRR